jgi:hypothetical protein
VYLKLITCHGITSNNGAMAAVDPDEGVVARRARFEKKLKKLRGPFDSAPLMRKVPEWATARGERDWETMFNLEKNVLPYLDGWRVLVKNLPYAMANDMFNHFGVSTTRALFPAYKPKLTDVRLFTHMPNYDVEFARNILAIDSSILLEQYIHIDPDGFPTAPAAMISELLWAHAIEEVMLLLEYEESAKYLNVPNEHGDTTLLILAYVSDEQVDDYDSATVLMIAKRLIDLGADPNIKDKYGRLASDITSHPELKAYLKSMEGLVRIGSEWRPRNNDQLPLGYRNAMLTLLLMAKA